MLYSLLIVQPRVARFFGADDDTREEFLTVLGAGNRRPVLAMIAALFVTWVLLAVFTPPERWQWVLQGTQAVLLVFAAAVFVRVSWHLWPRRVFALSDERPAHRRALHKHAVALVVTVTSAFVLAAVAITSA
jgi:hypothetical protein